MGRGYCTGIDGGDKGGQLVASGTPEEIVKIQASHTGVYLKSFLTKKH